MRNNVQFMYSDCFFYSTAINASLIILKIIYLLFLGISIKFGYKTFMSLVGVNS